MFVCVVDRDHEADMADVTRFLDRANGIMSVLFLKLADLFFGEMEFEVALCATHENGFFFSKEAGNIHERSPDGMRLAICAEGRHMRNGAVCYSPDSGEDQHRKRL